MIEHSSRRCCRSDPIQPFPQERAPHANQVNGDTGIDGRSNHPREIHLGCRLPDDAHTRVYAASTAHAAVLERGGNVGAGGRQHAACRSVRVAPSDTQISREGERERDRERERDKQDDQIKASNRIVIERKQESVFILRLSFSRQNLKLRRAETCVNNSRQ